MTLHQISGTTDGPGTQRESEIRPENQSVWSSTHLQPQIGTLLLEKIRISL